MKLHEDDLLRILEATRAISSTLRLSELLDTVIQLAREVMKSEAASFLLMDQATGELYFDVAVGEKGGALQHIRLKKGEGIAGWVAEHQKPAVVNDVAADPRWTQKGDDTSKFKTRSILAVPMQHNGRLIGVMEAINRSDNEPFSETDVQLLETFAAQAAVAIENARLFESIRQEKEKMSTIIGEMAEGTVLLDPEGRVLLTNRAAQTLLGPTLKDSGYWEDLEEQFTIRPRWAVVGDYPHGSPLELLRKQAPSLILSGVMTPIYNDKKKITGTLMVFANVTEERREAKLKTNFISLVSHKLKTPLVSLRGYTPLLLEKPEELNPFQKTAIQAIDRNSQQLASLVDKLVWFSVLEGDTLELQRDEPQQATALIEAALSDLGPFLRQMPAEIIQENIDILPALSVDKTWMKEVLRNLIENAIKFNPKEPRRVTLSGQLNGDFLEIGVTDNGPGIPSEEQEKIFQKFYQIETHFTGQVQGMGLGLALVKRVVEEHGGRVFVQSTLGEGSRFILQLPAR
jgi:two-component system phosphate regulon sensor histidine kinase PhoR